MADPKYADLPGIARGEPDVYETNDLPESDQTSDFYDEESESIESLQISASEAFNKFKGKSVNGGKVDFSERISKHLRTGYDARSGDWELMQQGQPETPLQKYQRLQCEMKELLEEINKIKQEKQEGVSCLVTEEQVEEALKKLTDLRLEESLGADVIANITDPQGAQIKKLFTQVEQFKTSASEQPESSQTDDNGIVYQLNYRPEQARFNQANRLAELENRLHRLETVLGSSSEKLSRLSSLTSKGSLLENAQHLSATASMLDSQQLDHIEGRLTALTQKLDAIAEKKAKIGEDAEKDQMVLELYDIIKNSENISKVLPQTIDRLKALEALHNKATEFTATLAQNENLQSSIQGSIENNKALLQGVQDSFAVNLEEMKKTILNLDARIKEISKK